MKFEDLTPEQKEKARAAKTPEEILALAKEEGFELSDDELEAISGGGMWDKCSYEDPCPKDGYCPSYCTYYGTRTPGP